MARFYRLVRLVIDLWVPKLVWAADLRLCPSRPRMSALRNYAIHPNRPSPRLRFVAEARYEATRGSSRFALFAAAARGSFVRPRVTSCGSEGIATNPITSREAPAQDARTSFRHPHVPMMPAMPIATVAPSVTRLLARVHREQGPAFNAIDRVFL